MHSTARVYFDATVALAIMATFGVIAGFVAIAATGDRMLALSATLAAFVLAGIVAVIRLWRSMREPMRPTKPGAAAEVVGQHRRRIQPSDHAMNEALAEIQRLLQEIAAHLGAGTRTESEKSRHQVGAHCGCCFDLGSDHPRFGGSSARAAAHDGG